MTTSTNASAVASAPVAPKQPLNGVDVPTLFATVNAVKGQPELAKFQFRATNRWQKGTHSKTTIESFSGAGGEHEHVCQVEFGSDHPAVLVGGDNAPAPVEFLLHGLAGCLTAGIGNIAAARGIRLRSVESRIEGNIDLLGLLGLSNDVRNGYQNIRITFEIDADGSRDEIEAVLKQSVRRSAVYDVLTNGVPVTVELA